MTHGTSPAQPQHTPGAREPYPTTPAMSPADIAAHQLASYVRPHGSGTYPTERLPAAGQQALAYLERALSPVAVTR